MSDPYGLNPNFVYPLVPRSLETAGQVRHGSRRGVLRSGNSPYGFNVSRSTMARKRRIIELSWQNVPESHLEPLEQLIDDCQHGAGLVITPSFRNESTVLSVVSPGKVWVNDNSKFSNAETTYNISTGVNDKLDFRYKDKDGVVQTKAVTISNPGTFTTHTLANLIATGMNDGLHADDPDFGVDFSGIDALGSGSDDDGDRFDDRWRIYEIDNTKQQGFLELLWHSGTNASTTIGALLGFDVSRDMTGKLTYSNQFFKSDYGHRVCIYSPGYVLRDIAYVEYTETDISGNYVVEFENIASSYNVVAGDIIEPVFNASIILPDQEGEAEFSMEQAKGQEGLLSTSILLVEQFNA